MEILTLILSMVSASALTIALITLNRYNSYHAKLNNYNIRITEINNNYGVMAKELEAAREAMQILTDNNNTIAAQVSKLTVDVQQLQARNLASSLVANPNKFVPSRANG